MRNAVFAPVLATRSVSYLLLILCASPGLPRSALGQSSRIEQGQIFSSALTNNLLGDSGTRPFSVYLPPSYDSTQKRYPAVYVLHGYGGTHKDMEALQPALDSMTAMQAIGEMIVVFVSGTNRLGGCQYLSSPVIGDYETYIAQDLVGHIDTRYRTLPTRNSRGITGVSMGGAGSMHLALKFPDIFGVVVPNAGYYDAVGDAAQYTWRLASQVPPTNLVQFDRLSFPLNWAQSLLAGLLPDLQRPELYTDYPYVLTNGQLLAVATAMQRLRDGDVQHGDLGRYTNHPVRLNAIKIVHGTNDNVVPISAARAFTNALTAAGVQFTYEEHPGGHAYVPELSLPFLSANLGAGILTPPAITHQPADFPSVSLGVNLTNRVSASGTPPPSCQWWFNGIPLASQTNTLLVLTNVHLADAGGYSVVVTNFAGSVTSRVVTLNVDATFTKITTGGPATELVHCTAYSWADYDNDGFPDLFLHNGWGTVSHELIFRNNGDGTFTPLSAPISPQGLAGWGPRASAWGDYDNDGHLDLFITTISGTNVLLHNRGDGTFEHILTGPGAEAATSTGAAWGDYDRDGYLDLLVINSNWGQSSEHNTLYHNQGDGSFQKMTANRVGSIVSDMALWTGAGWVDFNNDGWPELFALTINSKASLYDHLTNGRFGPVTNNALVTSTMPSAAFAWADYDNDGRLDLCVAGANTPTLLFHQEADGTFEPLSGSMVGIPASDQSQYGAVAWGDYDNDGFVDLFVAGGWWNGSSEVATKSFLYHNNGDGTFTPVRTGNPVNDQSDAAEPYWVDYNRDGFLDLFVGTVGNGGEPSSGSGLPSLFYRNNGNSNNWLCVTCVGTSCPRDGTGAKVRALATVRGKPMWQLRLINSGGTDWGGQSFVAHFGLGDATNVDVLRIEWSSGIVQELHNVPAKQYLTVTEPAKLSMARAGELHILCWKGMAYRIDSSPDLLTWTPLATVTNLNLTGGVQWTDPGAPGQATRFYRAVKQ